MSITFDPMILDEEGWRYNLRPADSQDSSNTYTTEYAPGCRPPIYGRIKWDGLGNVYRHKYSGTIPHSRLGTQTFFPIYDSETVQTPRAFARLHASVFRDPQTREYFARDAGALQSLGWVQYDEKAKRFYYDWKWE